MNSADRLFVRLVQVRTSLLAVKILIDDGIQFAADVDIDGELADDVSRRLPSMAQLIERALAVLLEIESGLAIA